jgi:hypothetical protein
VIAYLLENRDRTRQQEEKKKPAAGSNSNSQTKNNNSPGSSVPTLREDPSYAIVQSLIELNPGQQFEFDGTAQPTFLMAASLGEDLIVGTMVEQLSQHLQKTEPAGT